HRVDIGAFFGIGLQLAGQLVARVFTAGQVAHRAGLQGRPARLGSSRLGADGFETAIVGFMRARPAARALGRAGRTGFAHHGSSLSSASAWLGGNAAARLTMPWFSRTLFSISNAI